MCEIEIVTSNMEHQAGTQWSFLQKNTFLFHLSFKEQMFSTLFSFENVASGERIVEIVRTDIETEDKARKYFWLKISPANNLEITRFAFRSMSAEGEDGWQERGFEQGKLRFSATSAEFTPNGASEPVVFSASEDKETYPTEMADALRSYLSSQ